MPQGNERRFSFECNPLGKDALEVVSFSGVEALSELYSFDLVLVSRKILDLESAIGAPATLTIHADQGKHHRHGLVASFELTGKVNEFAFYRARLVPGVHPLTLGETCRVFLDKSIRDLLSEVFRNHGLASGVDYDMRLAGDYLSRPYISQFRESDFAFLSRWMERDGLSYFFEQGDTSALMVITDSHNAHKPLPGKSEFRYETPSGMVEAQGEEGVYSFSRRFSPLPKSVLLKDYNPETPSVDLSAEAPVLQNGNGAMRLYGEHYFTVEEGRKLAAVRAQELLCRRDVRQGKSSHPGMTPGFLFKLTNHFQGALNREHLLTRVRHQGRQFGFLSSGLGLSLDAGGEPETFYRNEFTAIPSDVQFRPRRNTPWPRLEGLMNAAIDGAGSGKYAEVDDQGRYKMIVAYDRSGRGGGKASHWVRMAQPYAGDDHGMHFPLHKGCEAVFACVDGDPDRPVLLGAVPNPDNRSVVDSGNQTRSVLQTAGSNRMYFEDKEGSERVLWQSEANKSFMRLGVPNDPPAFETEDNAEGSSGISIKTPGGYSIVCGSSLSTYMIGYIDTILGLLQESYLVTYLGINLGLVESLCVHEFKASGSETEVGFITTRLNGSKQQITANKNHLVGELVTARGRITTLDGQLDQLRQELDQLIAECDQLSQDVTTLAQEKTDLSGEVSDLAQQKTDLCQSNSVLAGEVQQLAQDKIDLHTQVTNLSAEVNELTEQATELSEQRTQLFSDINETCGEIMEVSDLDLTL